MKLLTYLQKKHQVTRREFIEMIHAGAVKLNDLQVKSFDHEIVQGDNIAIELEDGSTFTETATISFLAPKLVLFHKPTGCVVSKDDKHNKTIYAYLPTSRQKDFWYIGRLDKDSSGLMLLTNTPALVDYYENPQHNIHKVYEVEIDKPYRTKDVKKAKTGCNVDEHGEAPLDGGFYDFLSVVNINYHRDTKGKFRLTVVLNEGKKRHIRRLLRFLGYRVLSLKRVKVGKRQLGNLKPGKWRIQTKIK